MTRGSRVEFVVVQVQVSELGEVAEFCGQAAGEVVVS